MTWNEFQAVYKRQIANMANRLFTRWKLPAGVGKADVEQELWLGAWEAWQEFDARGMMSQEAYAVSSGKQRAARWIHGQRNALRRDGAADSRFAEGVEDVELFTTEQSTQFAALAFSEAIETALLRCRTTERAALKALLENAFDVDATTILIAQRGLNPRVARETVRKAYRHMQEAVA